MDNKHLKTKIGTAAKWSSITEVLSKLIMPITNMILARLIAPEAFGVIATISMIISFVEMFADAGFQKYIVQHEFSSEQEKNMSTDVAFWTNISISIILWLTIIIFRNSIANILGNTGLGNVIAVACVQLPLMSLSSIQTALYRRDFNFKILFVVRITYVLIPLFITVPLAIYGLSYWAIIIGGISGSISNAIILTIKSKWKPSFRYSFSLLREMFSFSMWTILESVASWFTTWLDAIIIGNAFSQYYLGLYKNSLNLVNSLMAIVSASIIPVLFSTLSRLQNDETLFQKTYYTIQKFAAYIVFPMGLGLYIYSDLATIIMFGNKWAEASGIVGIWSLMAAFGIVFSNFNGEVYRAKGKPRISFLYQIIHLSFLVPICLIAKGYGFWPLVYARSLTRLQGTIFGFIFMKVYMGFSIIKMIENVAKPLICTVAMGVVAFMLKQVSSTMTWDLLSIIICIFVYGVFIFVIAREDFNNILENLRIFKNDKQNQF